MFINRHSARRFIAERAGLVTIEWVAIAAIVLLAAVGISAFILQSADGLGGAVAGQMNAAAADVNGEGETP